MGYRVSLSQDILFHISIRKGDFEMKQTWKIFVFSSILCLLFSTSTSVFTQTYQHCPNQQKDIPIIIPLDNLPEKDKSDT